MKKLLLSLLAVAGMALSAAAAEVTLDFSTAEGLPTDDASADVAKATIEGVDCSFFHCKKGAYSGASYLQVSGKKYNGANAAYVEFKAPGKISKIVVTTGSNASTNVTVQLSAGGVNVGEAVKLDANSADFTFEVPAADQSDVCRFTTTNKYNAQFTKAVITYEAGTVTPPAVERPVITTAEGEECFIATITCATEGAEIYYNIGGEEPVVDAEHKYTAPVEMWGTSEIKAIAVKGEDKSGVVTAKVPLFLTDTSAFGDMASGTEFILKTQMTAIYQNGVYLYAKAGWSGNILIYGNVNKELANGDTFNRLEGKYSPFNNLPEIGSPVIGEVTAGGTPVEPFDATADLVSEATINYYLVFKDVKVDAWTDRNSTLTDADGNTVALYNQFKLPETELLSGDKCTVTGFVGIYKQNIQFYPAKIETTGSGIEGVIADENAPVEYFNLQGIRIANPEQGSVVIRRQGAKVAKTIIR